MARPEILTSAVLIVGGLALALWLAANRIPPTPAPPTDPALAAADMRLASPLRRELPGASGSVTLPNLDLGPNGLPCGPTLDVREGAPGMARVAVDAPCLGGAIVEIAHGPMRFSDHLSSRGTLRVDVPVLVTGADVIAHVQDHRLEAAMPVTPPAGVIGGLSWAAPLDLSLAAYEFGAAEGDAGHVTAERQRGAGRVIRLGDPAAGAVTEIYLGARSGGPGVVRLHAEITPMRETCTEPVPLTGFRADAGGVEIRDIRLTLAPCSGLPESVVLKNLLEDLKIAGR